MNDIRLSVRERFAWKMFNEFSITQFKFERIVRELFVYLKKSTPKLKNCAQKCSQMIRLSINWIIRERFFFWKKISSWIYRKVVHSWMIFQVTTKSFANDFYSFKEPFGIIMIANWQIKTFANVFLIYWTNYCTMRNVLLVLAKTFLLQASFVPRK